MIVAVAPVNELDSWVRTDGLPAVLYGLGAVLLSRFVSWFGQRLTDRIDNNSRDGDALVRSEAAKHRHAVAQVLTWLSVVLIYCVAVVLIVGRLGIPVTGLVAPATVAGVALGFGAQRIVQDLLAGFFIIAERQYGFGDVVKISALGSVDGVTGTVEDVSLRITQLRSSNGEVVIVPNGQIVQITNMSRDWARAVVDVPIPASADIGRVNDVLHDVGVAVFADPDLRPLLLDEPSVMGVESITVDEVMIRMVARTLPGKQFDVSRAMRAQAVVGLREVGITVAAEAESAARSGAA